LKIRRFGDRKYVLPQYAILQIEPSFLRICKLDLIGVNVIENNKYPTINVKRPMHCQLNWAILMCGVIPDGKTE
jgi:hypothetical protein